MQLQDIVAQLGALGINNMITAVSPSTVQVDIRTLVALISKAQKAEISVPMCVSCGFVHTARVYKDATGRPVAYCFACKPDDIATEWEEERG